MTDPSKRSEPPKEIVLDPAHGVPEGLAGVVYQSVQSAIPNVDLVIDGAQVIDFDSVDWSRIVLHIDVVSQTFRSVNGVGYVDVEIEPTDVSGAVAYEVIISE